LGAVVAVLATTFDVAKHTPESVGKYKKAGEASGQKTSPVAAVYAIYSISVCGEGAPTRR